MIQWGNIPTFMPTTTLFDLPQTTYAPQKQTFNYIPFGNITSFNYNIPASLPTPQGAVSYPNYTNWFNFTMPSLSNYRFPTINLSNIWNNITTTTRNLYNSARTTVSGTLTKVSNFASRIINKAKKYLGYNEKDGSYKKFTGGKNEAWCAHFATYVARESGSNIPHFSSVSDILNWGQKNGKFSKTPKVGDLVIYKGYNKNGKPVSHTGIVKEIKNGKIKTIEGNTSTGDVAERTCSINDTRVTGFVSVA